MSNTHLIQGKAQWAKIIGKPVPGYNDGPAEWTVDLVLDAKAKKELLALGCDKSYIKNKEGIGDYVRFVRKATKADGSPGKPFSIIDHRGDAWDNRLIGNGSTLNIAYTFNEVGTGKTKKLKPSALSIQVWDYVEYKPKSAFPVRTDAVDETFDVSTPEA